MAAYRRLISTDVSLYCEHLLRLDGDSRYARFSGFLSDASIRSHCARIDWRNTMVIGFFRDGQLRGAAEIRYEAKLFPSSAELAFSVEKAFQGSRIGSGLMKRTLAILGNRGVAQAHVVCLLTNHRMQRLALKFRSDVRASRGEVFMTVTVPPVNAASLMVEWLDGYLGWLGSNLDFVGRWIPEGRLARP
jgi:hypothetical protein